MSTRQERYRNFRIFSQESRNIFPRLIETRRDTATFSNSHCLCVCPGGRYGGNDEEVVEIFWGSMPFVRRNVVRNRGIERRFKSEYGATIFYRLLDDGYAICLMYPASTEDMRQAEDFIIYDYKIDPIILKNDVFLSKHINFFMSYMRVTSLDGNPSLIDIIFVNIAKITKIIVVDGVSTPRKISVYFAEITKYVLTVGLSGFLLYLVQKFAN